MDPDFNLGILKTISSFLNFFVIKKISKTSFKLYNFWNFESPAINNSDCIMTLEVFENFSCNGWLVMWVHDWPFVQGSGVQISLEQNFFFFILIIIFKWKLFFTSLWYSKPILYYSFFKFFMSSWKYLESKDVWGLRRVIELHIGKRRPFLFIISFAPSLGSLICLKSPLFNFRSPKLPNLIIDISFEVFQIQLHPLANSKNWFTHEEANQ